MSTIGQRKADHLALCATDEVAFRSKTSLFEQVRLVHDALPDLNADAIDTSTTLFGIFDISAEVPGPRAMRFGRAMAWAIGSFQSRTPIRVLML